MTNYIKDQLGMSNRIIFLKSALAYLKGRQLVVETELKELEERLWYMNKR